MSKIDKSLSKWVSRKLLVFLIACVGMFFMKITSSDWVVIATAYIGSQAFVDVVERLKK